jgi:hypothetical protein
LLEQTADHRLGRDARTASDYLDHRGELAFGFDSAAPHCLGSIAPFAARRVDPGEDAQLVGADAPLADRSVHERSIGTPKAAVDGQLMGTMGKIVSAWEVLKGPEYCC